MPPLSGSPREKIEESGDVANAPSASELYRKIHYGILLWVAIVLFLEVCVLVYLEWHVADTFHTYTQKSTEHAGALAKSSLHLGMHAAGEKPNWEHIGKSLSLDRDTRVTFVSSSGKVLWASNQASRGRQHDVEDPLCVICHQETPSTVPVFTSATGGLDEDLLAAPLLNKGECRTCHDKARKKLGVIYVRRSTASSSYIKGTTQISLGVLGMLVILFTYLFGRYIGLRFSKHLVKQFSSATPDAQQEFLTEVKTPWDRPPPEPLTPTRPLVRSDTTQLRINLKEAAEQRENLAILYGIAEDLSEQASLDDRRRRVVQQVTRIFQSDSVLISGHFHPQTGVFHGMITYLRKGELVPTEVPYPHEGIEKKFPHYNQELIDRWIEGDLELTTRIHAGSTVAYPLERQGKRLGLFLVPARPKGEDRPAGANPDMVQALRKHLAAALELAELQRVRVRQERLAAIGATVAGLAHCLKNTLNALRGGQYVVERAIELEEFDRLRKGYRVLKFGVGHIERLTQDMLMYASDRKLKREAHDPNKTLKEVAVLLNETARHQNVSVATDLDLTLGEVAIDPHAIYRAVLNLVTNAVDACVESEYGDKVTLKSRKRDGNLIITVQDNGVGMPPDVLRRVSEQFFTTKPSKGTGLGLPVVEKIAKLHDGELEIESQVGKGSSFHIVIPLKG